MQVHKHRQHRPHWAPESMFGFNLDALHLGLNRTHRTQAAPFGPHGTPHSQHPRQDLEQHQPKPLKPIIQHHYSNGNRQPHPKHHSLSINAGSVAPSPFLMRTPTAKAIWGKHLLDQIQSTNLLQSLGLGKAERNTWQRLAKNSNHDDTIVLQKWKTGAVEFEVFWTGQTINSKSFNDLQSTYPWTIIKPS